MITVARSAILFAPALPPASVASPGLGYAIPIFHECDVLPQRVSRVPQPWISRLARAVGYAAFVGIAGARDRIPGWAASRPFLQVSPLTRQCSRVRDRGHLPSRDAG